MMNELPMLSPAAAQNPVICAVPDETPVVDRCADNRHLKCSKALARVEERIGLVWSVPMSSGMFSMTTSRSSLMLIWGWSRSSVRRPAPMP